MFWKAKRKETAEGGTELAVKPPVDKAKKKKIRRRVIAGILTALVISALAGNSLLAKNAPPTVQVKAAEKGDVEQLLRTKGVVKSGEAKTYFAPVSAPLGEVKVAAGDAVKRGDVLLAFDKVALAQAKQESAYKLTSSQGGYKSALHKDNEYMADLAEASRNLPVLDTQIADNENYLKELNKKIEDKRAGLAYHGTNLQVSIIEWQQAIEEHRQQGASMEQLSADQEILVNLQTQAQYNSYEQQNNKDIKELEREAKRVEELIAGYKEYRAEMKSQKSASEGGVLDEGGREKLEADVAFEQLANQKKLDAITAVEQGLKADFSGVVTEVEALPGATPAEGGKLLTLESTEEVCARLSLSKYDLEKIALGQKAEIDIAGKAYEGAVTKIAGAADPGGNGAATVGVDVAIHKPDAGVFLGVEVKVSVHLAKAEGVVTIPLEVVGSDAEGDFVFVEKDGLAAKRRIVMGISDESVCEVKEGLQAGEKVIYAMGMELEDGMAVKAVEQNDASVTNN